MTDFLSQFGTLDKDLDDFYKSHRLDESTLIKQLISKIPVHEREIESIQNTSQKLIHELRENRVSPVGIEHILLQYKLNSEQGVALMCLAEAMLRVPDRQTINELIQDKLGDEDWSGEPIVKNMMNRSMYWGLMISGKILGDPQNEGFFKRTLKSAIRQVGQPALRSAIGAFLKFFASQFVLGQDLKQAEKNSKKPLSQGYSFSYDQLGEAALTYDDAERYFQSYIASVKFLQGAKKGSIYDQPGISVKLSALHPRYEYAHRAICVPSIVDKLKTLCIEAKKRNLGLIIDAEEADRFELALTILKDVMAIKDLDGWNGLGIAVQAYQKRTYASLEYMIKLAKKSNRRLMVRLTKGAYWDMEIKHSQVNGDEDYPVFTYKKYTDVSYLACSRLMLDARDEIYPMFATHNAMTIATIKYWAESRDDYEFQRLHGMGEHVYSIVMKQSPTRCRIYAPVGDHNELLPYLVRRLLENGASSSFIHRVVDPAISVNDLLGEDPLLMLGHFRPEKEEVIPKPIDIFGDVRKNSLGIDLNCPYVLQTFSKSMDRYSINEKIDLYPYVVGLSHKGSRHTHQIKNPADTTDVLGQYRFASVEDVQLALENADDFKQVWQNVDVLRRANFLDLASNLLEKRMDYFVRLLILEAGKSWADAVNEVREAVDFLRYYAVLGRKVMQPKLLPGPTGEQNQLQLEGRGLAVCISPWNFPLAIFIGQVSAALVSGNVVIAKPASQTVAIASKMVDVLYEVGLPKTACQLLPGERGTVGKHLMSDERVDIVMLTGSTATAKSINRDLANRSGPIIPLIAETGGQNAMIIDSSALLEQAVNDVMMSSFYSAGQRCSAARVVYIQSEVADRFIEMLQGALEATKIGPTAQLTNDIGPIIDEAALDRLNRHLHYLNGVGNCIYQPDLTEACKSGTFFAPAIYEINHISELSEEVFGPILHIIRFDRRKINQVIDDINDLKYGLTFGVHSRISRFVDNAISRIQAGNVYVNRTIIGAQVGVQPFGGEGLSGTGPKAGGPLYLYRLTKEKTISNNTAAIGGNIELVSPDATILSLTSTE